MNCTCMKVTVIWGVGYGGRKTEEQTQPTYDAGSGNLTRATCWETSALTTVPHLLPKQSDKRVAFTSH